LYTGKEFSGQPIVGVKGWTKVAVNEFIYLWLQDAIEAFQEHNQIEDTSTALGLSAPAAGLAWTGIGVQTYPPTARTSVALLKDSFAQETYNKSWDELKPVQQRSLIRRHKKELEEPEQQVKIESAKERDYGFLSRVARQNREAGDAVIDSLPEETVDEFARLGITIMLSRTISNYRLDDKRYTEYQQATGQHLESPLSRLLSSPAWGHYSDSRKEEKIKRKIMLAKRAAQREVLRGIKAQ